MWSFNIRAAPTKLFRTAEQFTQLKRTTYILKRRHPIRLNPLGSVFPKKLKRRHYYYDLVENSEGRKRVPLEVVLTSDVPGVGMRGEKVEMNPYVAYRDLLLPKLAIYSDSPEAQDILKDVKEKVYSSKYSKIVENYLASQSVKIILSSEVKWTLKPWHIKFALRSNGIMINEDCIRVPKEISGPNNAIEDKDFIVYLTMNKSEVFPVRCRIYHWSTVDPTLNQKSFDLESPSEALFPDEKEVIDSLIKVEQEIKRNRMRKGESK